MHFPDKIDKLFISTLILITIVFFGRLFYPELLLFSTPDFGQSDIWQLNLPNKFFLSESLRMGQLPLWNPYIGGGFPSLAEGQIGTFNSLNLLFFRFLPFVVAYNISYIVIFLIASIGTYAYSRTIKLSRLSSLFAGLLFSFSGFFITHISHFNLIQSAAFLPWLLFTTENFLRGNKILWGILLSLVLSQQIFSGFPQITFISLIGLILHVVFHLVSSRLKRGVKLSFIFYLLSFIFLGFLASAIQLLPQKEFLDLSNRSGGLPPDLANYFSYPFKHLKTLIFPYSLGDPRAGTYPDFHTNNGSIFWENTAYIGILPLLLAIFSLIRIKDRKIQFYILLLFLSLLLMAGKYSPLYITYSIPPFSYFRGPSRFIILFLWSLVILASLGLDRLTYYLSQKYKFSVSRLNILKISLISIASIQLFYFSYNYNSLLPSHLILKNPPATNYLKDTNAKIFSFGSGIFWNEIFLTKGWQDSKDYLYFSNALLANENLLREVKSINVYRTQITRRYETILNALESIPADQKTLSASPSALTINLLSIFGVDTIITQYNLPVSNMISKINSIPNKNSIPPFNIYKLQNQKPLFYLTDKWKKIVFVEDFYETIAQVQNTNTALLEKDLLSINTKPQLKYSLDYDQNKDTHFKLRIVTNKPAILVFNNSFYPGWLAKINKNTQTIFPVNINQMGLLLNKGPNEVEIVYKPLSFSLGVIISLSTYLVLTIIFILKIFYSRR